MHRCSQCDAVFEDFKEWHKDGGCYEADYGVYFDFDSHNYYPPVDWLGCPECGASEDECYELEECERCGEFVDELNHGLCENCYDDLHS